MNARIKLILDDVASFKILNEFHFEKLEKGNIEALRKIIKNILFNSIVTDESMFQMRSKEEIEDTLLAVAIQYIQISYYKKPEDYKVRWNKEKYIKNSAFERERFLEHKDSSLSKLYGKKCITSIAKI